MYADLQSAHRSCRLLQGDVGSGKTVVAVLALLRTAECGRQGVIMAPTELLATQHYRTMQRYFALLGNASNESNESNASNDPLAPEGSVSSSSSVPSR